MYRFLTIFILLPFCRTYPTNSGTKAQDCSDGYENHPVILISLDGFRAEYMERNLTPNIDSIIKRGVSAAYMVPTYPSITFPNHYTIVTGLYPESHGIIANFFCDPHGDCFGLGWDESFDPKWWGGNPLWNTVTDQGKLSAAMFWPGADVKIEGKYPTYYYKYNDSISYSFRIDQVLDWLALPFEERPQFITLYFDEPDHTGHEMGPNSSETEEMIIEMDTYIGDLLTGIENLNLTSCVNLIIISDHGMAHGGEDMLLQISNYIPDLLTKVNFNWGAFARLDIYEPYCDEKEEMHKNLSCQSSAMRQFDPTELPKRFHYSNNDRIDDIILDLDPGYYAQSEYYFHNGSSHGYDNYYQSMNAIFVAAGPNFKVNYISHPFQNHELYNLMCSLLEIIPSPNNGTDGSLNHLLLNPPEYPTIPPESHPNVPVYPNDQEITDRLNISGCPGDLITPENWLSALNFSFEEQQTLEAYHLPFGLLYSNSLSADLIMLYQEDHITGFSERLKMPLWTSFTLEGVVSGTLPSEWSSDIRLENTNTPTCGSYAAIQRENITMAPLFRPGFSINSSLDRIPYTVGNAVPMARSFEDRWTELMDELIPTWITISKSAVNVVVGPIFDNNYDSLVDNFTNFGSNPEVPSDFFVVLTRCKLVVTSLGNCSTTDLENLSFIYHYGQIAPNCLSRDHYAHKFSSKVKDVEIATGLTFYTDLSYEESLRLKIRVEQEIWPTS